MAYAKTTWKNRVVQNPNTYLQQQNADGSITLVPKEGTVTEAGTPVNAVNMNNIENGISALDAEKSIYSAGGTANAITVTTANGDYSYAQFKKLSIKAASDNTGNVTIKVDGNSAVPTLKYDSSQLPAGAIKAGKVYDFYYDTTGNCFFLIAKASGNAVAADVLAGKTFSNDSDSGLVGTATIASLGGKEYASGTTTVNASGGSAGFYSQTITLDFIPTMAFSSPSGANQYYSTCVKNGSSYIAYAANGSSYTRSENINSSGNTTYNHDIRMWGTNQIIVGTYCNAGQSATINWQACG